MDYPTMEQVEQAERITLCRWYRFLPSPITNDQIRILTRIAERFRQLGGMTPAISKAIGWNE